MRCSSRPGQVEVRHARARLDRLRIGDPAGEIAGRVRQRRRRRCVVRLIRWREVGRRACRRPRVPRTVWQAPQRTTKACSPRCDLARGRAAAPACSCAVPPGVELGRRFGDDQQRHVRVLRAAEFGALAAIDARPCRPRARSRWSGPGSRRSCRPARHPERVDHVGADQA